MSDKMTKSEIVGWVSVRMALFSFLFLWVVKDEAPAQNVIVFFTWLSLVAMIAIVLTPAKPKPRRLKPESFKYIDTAYSILAITALVWFGLFFTAAALVLFSILSEAYRRRESKVR